MVTESSDLLHQPFAAIRRVQDARLGELVFQIDKTTLIRRQRQDPPAAKGGRS
ncbi:MAG: hypothetical protein HY615_14590 [Candidatus Rokubacteria bacterium]|nr:hypothetical protein [Candidatus Rokubacteria bacterium]